MKNIATIVTDTSVTAYIGNKAYTVNSQDAAYKKVIEAIKKGRAGDIPSILDKATTIQKQSSGKITVKNGQVYYGGEVLDNYLAQKIVEFIEKGLPFKSLVKFTEKVMQNKDKRLHESLYKFMELEGLPINENGCVLAYKSLKPNMTDHYSGKVKHKVGATIRWGQRKNESPLKDVDFGVECSNRGYHIGIYQYASNFGGHGSVLCLVEIDPRHIISTPSISTQGKIRVSQYKVLDIYNKKNPLVKDFVKTQYANKDNKFTTNRTGQKVLRGPNGKFIRQN